MVLGMLSTVVVIDLNSYTKMGYAGNSAPQFIIPTSIAAKPLELTRGANFDDLEFFVGDEAQAHSSTMDVCNPVRKGQVDNWTQMEQVWQHCIFKYLRCEPEDHYFCLVCRFHPFKLNQCLWPL